jgi:hypothetical protein
MSVYHIPLEGMKQGRIVREIHCANCDSSDLFLPRNGQPCNSDIICCADCGAPVGQYKQLLELLEGGPGLSKQCKAVSRIEWPQFDYG